MKGRSAVSLAAVGRKRHATGAALEAGFHALHQLYRLRSLAWIQKQYTATVRTPRGLVNVRQSNPPDYLGVVDLGSEKLTVCFDVKDISSSGGASFRYPLKERHQVRTMLDLTESGLGLGFLVLVDRRHEIAYLVDRKDDLLTLLVGRRLTLRAVSRVTKPAHYITSLAPVRYVAGWGWDWRKALIEQRSNSARIQ